MSHKTKAKTKGIGASSFFDLKAELSKQETEFAKKKASGESTRIVGGIPRPGKKPTVWARQNKGVAVRASRDAELEAIDKPTLESARTILERKAKIYAKLKKGKSGGLNDAQYDALLVDFDTAGPSNYYESDSDDVDESLSVPQRHEDDRDPLLEYEDELGRTRMARKSDIPRHLLPKEHREIAVDEDEIIYNPEGHFPVYVPSDERIQEIEKKYAESNNPLVDRYDSTRENRAKGAGFYQFSNDEVTRKEQMEALKQTRMETEKNRQDTGAVDVRPGETEGMREGEAEGTGKVGGVSRAMEKRKRELEERRKLIEAKRRKVQQSKSSGDGQKDESVEFGSSPPPVASPASQKPPVRALVPQQAHDPFAVLEASISPAPSGTAKPKGRNRAEPVNEADAFLSRLEEEFLGSKGKEKQG